MDETTGSSGMCPETVKHTRGQLRLRVPDESEKINTGTGGSLEQNISQHQAESSLGPSDGNRLRWPPDSTDQQYVPLAESQGAPWTLGLDEESLEVITGHSMRTALSPLLTSLSVVVRLQQEQKESFLSC